MQNDWYFRIAVPALAFVGAVLTIWFISRNRRWLSGRLRRIGFSGSNIFEVLIILPAVAGSVCLAMTVSLPELLNPSDPRSGAVIEFAQILNFPDRTFMLIGRLMVVLFLPLLMIRQTRRRWLALLAVVVVIALPVYLAFGPSSTDEAKSNLLRHFSDSQSSYFLGWDPPILISSRVSMLRPIPILLLSFALAATCLRRPRWAIPLLGGIGAFVIQKVTTWFLPQTHPGIAFGAIFLCGALFSSALLLLPLQRRALAIHLGMSTDAKATTRPLEIIVSRILATIVASALVMSVPLFALLSFAEVRVFRTPTPTTHSLAAVNAWPMIMDLYSRKAPQSIDHRGLVGWGGVDKSMGRPVGLEAVASLRNVCYDADFAAIMPLIMQDPVKNQILTEHEFFEAYIERLQRIVGADFLSTFNGNEYRFPSFQNIREVSRQICRESSMLATEGKFAEARDRIELVLNLGCLMRDGGLVTHMMGTAVRGLATDAMIIYLQAARDDRAALEGLRNLTKKYRANARQSIPMDNIAHYEPGFAPIVPMWEFVVPDMDRAVRIYYRILADYDRVELTTALSLYRIDHGKYPDSLPQILDSNMERIPIDPTSGNPYVYRNLGDHFELICPAMAGDAVSKRHVNFTFPVRPPEGTKP